ncbi:MAG: hypothetical protein ABEJ31_02165 [Haloarculaceae archaeon]
MGSIQTDGRDDGGDDADAPGPAETRLLAACTKCRNICLCIVTDGDVLRPYGTASCPECDGMDFDPEALS